MSLTSTEDLFLMIDYAKNRRGKAGGTGFTAQVLPEETPNFTRGEFITAV